MLVMLTWRRGTRILSEVTKRDEMNLAGFHRDDGEIFARRAPAAPRCS